MNAPRSPTSGMSFDATRADPKPAAEARPLSLSTRIAALLALAGIVGGFRAVEGWNEKMEEKFAQSERREAGNDRDAARPAPIASPTATSFSHWDFHETPAGQVLMVHPPTRMEWTLDPGVRAVVVGFGFFREAYDKPTNGADFILELVGAHVTQTLMQTRLRPHSENADRGEKRRILLLPPFEAGSRLVFRTTGGEYGDLAWDWVYLSELTLLTRDAFQPRRYPGFNRYPDKVIGENFAIFHEATGDFLFAAAPATLEFPLSDNEHRVSWDFGFLPNSYSDGGHSNGGVFRIALRNAAGNVSILDDADLKPQDRPADRGVQHRDVIMPAHRRGDRLILSVLPGENNDAAWDHTYIRRVTIN